MKCMILEDLDVYYYIIKFYLQSYISHIYLSSSLDDAKKITLANNPELFIVDIRLNDKIENNRDGFIFLDWLNKLNIEKKVIMISAYGSSDYAIESFNKGADYFLNKPLSPAKLIETVNKLI